METSLCFSTLLLLLLGAIFSFHSPVIAGETFSDLKLNSRILQDSIIKKVNENPKAGWKATMNRHFSNYTVSCLYSNTPLKLEHRDLKCPTCAIRARIVVFPKPL